MLKIGSAAPDFALPASDGTVATLKQFRGKKVVLYFYAEGGTGTCEQQACSFRDHSNEITKKGAVVVGVSPDTADFLPKYAKKLGLPFVLLADPDKAVMKKYCSWGKKIFFGKNVVGLLRNTFIIDERGKIEKIYERVRGMEKHVQQVVKDLA